MNTQGMIPAKENANKKISDRYQKKTYAKGATCIYGDTLYRAKADITTAEEWNAAHWEETNMETIRAEMAAEVSSLNANKSESITVSFLNSQLTFIKVGRVVQVSYLGDTVSSVATGNLGKVATLPSGFQPISNLYVLNLPLSDIKIQLNLFRDGTIEAYNYGIEISRKSTCRYTFSYITKD